MSPPADANRRSRRTPPAPTIHSMRRLLTPAIARFGAVFAAALAGATLAVAVLEELVGVPHASAVYLAAVVATALVAGTWGAIASAVAAFLLYNLLFTEPRFTLRIADPGEWLGVVLLLFVGVVVGELAARREETQPVDRGEARRGAALERARGEDARAREREARALFQVSRQLVTRSSTADVLSAIAAILRDETGMARLRIMLGADQAGEVLTADSGGSDELPAPGRHRVLQRRPGDEPARWTTVHQPGQPGARRSSMEAFRVRIEAAEATVGSVWAFRHRERGEPNRTATRLLAAAADQIGLAITHDRLVREARLGEVARESDELKTALLQSLSHDLRTPLATIRTAAGTLRSGTELSEADHRASVEAIEREVEYLNRLVTNLLDLGRIEGGALRPEADVFEIDDLVGPTLDRIRPRLAGRALTVDLRGSQVRVDPTFVDEALTNVLENAIKHTPPGTRIEVRSVDLPADSFVRLTVEDSGPGVEAPELDRIFERFYQAPSSRRDSRAGTGVGLAVARGLVEATGGRIAARRGDIGGLAVDLDLPARTLAAAGVGQR